MHRLLVAYMIDQMTKKDEPAKQIADFAAGSGNLPHASLAILTIRWKPQVQLKRRTKTNQDCYA